MQWLLCGLRNLTKAYLRFDWTNAASQALLNYEHCPFTLVGKKDGCITALVGHQVVGNSLQTTLTKIQNGYCAIT